MSFYLQTNRIILREWRDDDIAPFSRMNADSDVMRYFPRTLSEVQTASIVDRLRAHQQKHGYCFWAAELVDSGEFIGFVGLMNAPDDVPCSPAIEIGWRLRKEYWGLGLAPEAATACLAYGFSALQVSEIVSFTAKLNLPSQRVMQKVGMQLVAGGDFMHPALETSHALAHHVLYRKTMHI